MIHWMKKRKYPFTFSTEASVNLADDETLMQKMVQAGFDAVFGKYSITFEDLSQWLIGFVITYPERHCKQWGNRPSSASGPLKPRIALFTGLCPIFYAQVSYFCHIFQGGIPVKRF